MASAESNRSFLPHLPGLPHIPTEIWFIIFRMEHAAHNARIVSDIKKLRTDTDQQNTKIIEDFGGGDPLGPGDLWNYNEYLAFQNASASTFRSRICYVSGYYE